MENECKLAGTPCIVSNTGVTNPHETETHSYTDVTNMRYSINKLSTLEKGKVVPVIRIKPNKFLARVDINYPS